MSKMLIVVALCVGVAVVLYLSFLSIKLLGKAQKQLKLEKQQPMSQKDKKNQKK